MPSEFERVAFVWGENESGSRIDQIAQPPSVGVAVWPKVLDCAALRWREGQMPDLSKYRLMLVNLFHTDDSTHPQQIRAAYPEMFIVGMPDANIDLALMHPGWTNLWDQLAVCDVIGGRTPEDCAVYGAFFNKPTVWLPSPIYPLAHFEALRDTPKEDYILTQDHTMHAGLFAQNVAALALIQRETGMRVVYTAQRDPTPAYAARAGLKVDFRGHVPFEQMTALTARARLCVDMYLRHSYGRQAVLCAAVGTPMVGSAYILKTGHPQVDPLNPAQACAKVRELLSDAFYYHAVRESGFQTVQSVFATEASRRRVRELLDAATGGQVL